MTATHRLYTDGGARGNPGPAGIGAVLLSPEGEVIDEVSSGIGWATNNVAEYRGLIEGLRMAKRHGVSSLHVHMDSLLVVQQMKGIYKVKHAGLRPLHSEARGELAGFERVRFEAIPRERNAHADRLMNEGIDAWLAENPDVPPPPRSAQEELF